METACLCLESDNHEKEGSSPLFTICTNTYLFNCPFAPSLPPTPHASSREHAIGVEEKTYVPMVSSTVGFSLYSNSEQFKENGRLKK
ncbi:hypothetical protein PAV_1c03720 [Paenibacillus alvei DSM 29]|nr:hypothetical protein PAV_1c03720 [Paenibacillus alvei DSM 29]